MNAHKLLTGLLAGALLGGTGLTLTHAQTPGWQTFAYQGVPGLNASSGDIGTDPSGSFVFAVGSARLNVPGPVEYRTALVQISADHGATWAIADAYTEPGWEWPHFRAFAADEDGGLFAAGEVFNSADRNKFWVVRESQDGGATWVTTDAVQPAGGNNASCGDLKVSPYTGDAFAVGWDLQITPAGVISNQKWVVRKRAAGATQFVNSDAVSGGTAGSEAKAVGFSPAGVFVVGQFGASLSSPVWTVRRSVNGGASWTTVDSFKTADWTQSYATGLTVDATGRIYVCGWAKSRLAPTSSWVVRTSADGGNTWAIVDDFRRSASTATIANAVTVDEAGNLLVAGYAETSQGLRWLVRKGVPGTTLVKQGKKWVPVFTVTWTTLDDYQMFAGKSARANAVTTDASGNLFVSGRSADQNGVDQWVVRKLPAAP